MNRGRVGVKNPEIFAYVLNGSPLTMCWLFAKASVIYRSFSQLLKPRQVPDTDNFYRINYGRSYGWIVVPKYWSNHASVDHCQECGVLGYNSVDLLCSSCDALVQFRLGHHSEDCKKCCKQDGDAGLQSQSKYPRAILEVCG